MTIDKHIISWYIYCPPLLANTKMCYHLWTNVHSKSQLTGNTVWEKNSTVAVLPFPTVHAQLGPSGHRFTCRYICIMLMQVNLSQKGSKPQNQTGSRCVTAYCTPMKRLSCFYNCLWREGCALWGGYLRRMAACTMWISGGCWGCQGSKGGVGVAWYIYTLGYLLIWPCVLLPRYPIPSEYPADS